MPPHDPKAAPPPELDGSARRCRVCGALNPAPLAAGGRPEPCIRCGSDLDGAEPRRAVLDPERLGPTRAVPAILAVCGASLALEIVLTRAAGAPFPWLGCDGRVAYALGALDPSTVSGAPLRFLSAVFVHFGLLHLLANGLVLRDIGGPLERLIGWARVALVFVVTGVLGFVATWLLADPSARQLTAGASGGVLGVAGALLGLLVRRRDRRWRDFAGRTLLFGIVMGFAVNSSSAGIAINNAAHVGGFLAGLPLGWLFGGEHVRPTDAPLPLRALALLLGALALYALAAAPFLLPGA